MAAPVTIRSCRGEELCGGGKLVSAVLLSIILSIAKTYFDDIEVICIVAKLLFPFGYIEAATWLDLAIVYQIEYITQYYVYDDSVSYIWIDLKSISFIRAECLLRPAADCRSAASLRCGKQDAGASPAGKLQLRD